MIWRARGAERDNMISVTAFFGFLTVFFVISLVEAVRLKRQLKLNATVSLAPKHKFTTRNWKIMGLLVSLLVLGIVVGVFTHYSLIPKFIGWFIALVGAAGLILLLMRTSSLVFSQEGVLVSARGAASLVRWDNIINLKMISIYDNPAIGYDVRSLEDLVSGHPSGTGGTDKVLTKITQSANLCSRMYGCQFYIMPGIYGADAGYLFRAMERYISQPDVRGELKAREALPLST